MRILVQLFLVCMLVSSAYALDAQQVSKTLRVTYDEPTTNFDATPLTDLGGTLIQVIADGTPLSEVDVPASSLTGGGSVSQDVSVPFTPNKLVTVDLEVSAYDTSGNVSEILPLNLTIDWLPPGKVQ